MKFKDLTIKNFRGVRECEINDLTRINLFVGQNNSGKSSILEALFLLSGYGAASLVMNIDYIRNLLHNEPSDFKFVFYNLDYKNIPTLQAQMYDFKETRKLQIIPKGKNQKKQITSSTTTTTTTTANPSNADGISSAESTEEKLVDSLEFHTEFKAFQQQRRFFTSTVSFSKVGDEITFKNENQGEKSFIEFKALIQGTNYRHTPQIAERLEKVIIDKKKNELISDLQLIESKISDITSFSNNMIYVDIGAKSLIPSNLMGDGFLKFLNIILNMGEVRDGVLLIDELDNGLHFTTLRKVWRVILRVAFMSNIQVFLTTHSKEAISYLKEVLEELDFRNYQPFVNCYTISKDLNNNLKAFKYDFNSFEYAMENDVEIRGEI